MGKLTAPMSQTAPSPEMIAPSPAIDSSARIVSDQPKADYRAPDSSAVGLPEHGEKADHRSIRPGAKSKSKTASHRSIRQKPASRSKPIAKGEKLPVAKSRGKKDSWTVAVDERQSFRIRLTESGYAVVLTWKDGATGKWPERYLCYLSKREWAKAKKGNLQSFARLIAEKIEQRKIKGDADAGKLNDLLRRVNAFR
jgi:hypothetical protein